MWLLGLFGLGVLALILGLYFVKEQVVRRTSVILFFIGLIAGYLVEYWGVTTEAWAYSTNGTDLFMVSEIPFEIIFTYGVGLFLLGIFIHELMRYYREDERIVVLKAFPIIGTFFFAVALVHDHIPWGVGLSFLAIWGLMISDRQSIPILVGTVAFFADMMIEGTLTWFTDYDVWGIGVSVAFMLIGITIAGVLTRQRCDPSKGFCFVEVD